MSAQSDQGLHHPPEEGLYPISTKQRLASDWADAQADRSLPLSCSSSDVNDMKSSSSTYWAIDFLSILIFNLSFNCLPFFSCDWNLLALRCCNVWHPLWYKHDCSCIIKNTYEPPHDKTNNVAARPAKTQISLGIRPVWSESSLSAWRKLGSLATHSVHSEDSDQSGRMPRLIWVFVVCTATLLVLSQGGSYVFHIIILKLR